MHFHAGNSSLPGDLGPEANISITIDWLEYYWWLLLLTTLLLPTGITVKLPYAIDGVPYLLVFCAYEWRI